MRMRFFNVGGLAGVWLAASAAVLAGPAEALFQGAWDWHLQPRHYGKLSMEERAAYARGEDLIAKGQYEAAALEFEKFLTAYPKNAAYGHALLLEGYSFHLGRFRNKAIDRYKEVIEMFGDKPDSAAPAAFLKGMALIENGNEEQGYAALQEMADNNAYLENPVADLALARLADRYMALNDEKNAERCWLRVMEAFQNAFDVRPEAAAASARQKLAELYIRQARAGALDDLAARFPQDGRKPADVSNFAFDRGIAIFDSLSAKARKGLFDWLRGRRADYQAENREGEWFNRLLSLGARAGLRSEWGDIVRPALDFLKTRPDADSGGAAASWLAARLSEASALTFKNTAEWKAFGDAVAALQAKLDPAGQLKVALAALAGFPWSVAEGSDGGTVWDAMIARARDLYLKQPNPEKDNGLAGLVDRLRNSRRFDRALELAQRIERPPLQLWKRIEVLGAQDKFVEQAAACDELEKMDDTELSLRALRHRAYLYRVRLAKYDEAVKLYAMINEPPGTIWDTVDCYQRWRKPDNAIAALSEIEGFFERDAPRAGLHKAYVWEQAGDKAKTIAALRTVLKKYPKDAVASTAHQMLERYGVEGTGGGVIDED